MGDYHLRADPRRPTAPRRPSPSSSTSCPSSRSTSPPTSASTCPRRRSSAELQTDYFFGKPVAAAKVEVTASTFDVPSRTSTTWRARPTSNGHAKFEIKLPDYFVGQPLQKGNALVKLEVKVTDTADHTETISQDLPGQRPADPASA